MIISMKYYQSNAIEPQNPTQIVDYLWGNVTTLLKFEDGDFYLRNEKNPSASYWQSSDSLIHTSVISKFGDKSFKHLPNQGSVSSVRDDLDTLSGLLTVEAWVYPESVPSPSDTITRYCFRKGNGPYTQGWGVGVRWDSASSSPKFFFYCGGGTLDNLTITSVVPVENLWYHLALTFVGTHVRLFINGVLAGERTLTYIQDNEGLYLYLGRDPGVGYDRVFQGCIDEVRITKGAIRYSGDFTPPDKSFPTFGPPIQVLTPPAIGEYWTGQGGYYAGEISYPDGRDYYLVVAPRSSLSWKSWGAVGYHTLAKSLYDGLENTETVMNIYWKSPGSNPGFEHCRNYSLDGHSDFYLPSLSEANVIKSNLNPINSSTPTIFKDGGSQAYYSDRIWTSTEVSETGAYAINMYSTEQSFSKESIWAQIRPIRRVRKAS